MPHQPKATAEEKMQLVTKYIDGRMSLKEALVIAQVHSSTFMAWVRQYKADGPLVFIPVQSPSKYTQEIKDKAVQEYLTGEGSQEDICAKYHIRQHSTLQNWIKVYNNHSKAQETTGGTTMTKNTPGYTIEERIQIVQECLANGKNYAQTAEKYQLSYQQVYTWVQKYIAKGEAGLQDRRGQRKKDQIPRTPEEEVAAKIAQLEHANYMLQMENDFLKKVDERERRRG